MPYEAIVMIEIQPNDRFGISRGGSMINLSMERRRFFKSFFNRPDVINCIMSEECVNNELFRYYTDRIVITRNPNRYPTLLCFNDLLTAVDYCKYPSQRTIVIGGRRLIDESFRSKECQTIYVIKSEIPVIEDRLCDCMLDTTWEDVKKNFLIESLETHPNDFTVFKLVRLHYYPYRNYHRQQRQQYYQLGEQLEQQQKQLEQQSIITTINNNNDKDVKKKPTRKVK